MTGDKLTVGGNQRLQVHLLVRETELVQLVQLGLEALLGGQVALGRAAHSAT